MNSRAGFTLIEVLIFGAIASFALLCLATLLNKPGQMQRLLSSSETPREATLAMDTLVDDLLEAVPGSVQWDVSSATSPLVFAKPYIDREDTSSSTIPMAYGYEGPDQGPGALVRVEGSTMTDSSGQDMARNGVETSTAVITRTIVLSPIDPPTEEDPLFQYDPQLQIIAIDIHYHVQGKPPIQLVRRVAITK